MLVAFMLWSGYGTITSAAAWVEIGAIPHKTFWALGWRVVTIAAFVVMLFQLPSRSQLARWSGVCALMSCAVFPVLWAWLNKPPPGSGAEYFGYILGLMLVLSPFALWAYGFGFARRAKAYFVATPRN